MGIIGYAFGAIVLSFIIKLLGDYFKSRGNMALYRQSRIVIILIFLPLFLGGVLFAYAKYIEPNWIQITKVAVPADRATPSLKALKIVHLSDLQVRDIGPREKKLARIMYRLNPDIILITGDFIDDEEGLEPCLTILRMLRARYGIFAILGNTDVAYYRTEKITRALTSAGVTVLNFRNYKITLADGTPLWIVGMPYSHSWLEGIGTAFTGIPLEDFKIAITHNPNVMKSERMDEHRPQLVLAGHTHGGQIDLPFLWKYSSYLERSPWMRGFYTVRGIPFYVNRGIGMTKVFVRFLCRPEITVIKLVNK